MYYIMKQKYLPVVKKQSTKKKNLLYIEQLSSLSVEHVIYVCIHKSLHMYIHIF